MEINVNWPGMTGIDKCRIATALKPLKEQNVVSLHELHETLGLAEPQHIVLDFDIKDENGKRAQGLHVHYI